MVLWFLSHTIGWGPIFPTFAFAVSFIFWGVILVVLGLPLGLLLHKLRLRHWLVAVVVGGAMTFLVVLALVALLSEFIPPHPISWWGVSQCSILGAGGTVVTPVMWRIAYQAAL
jgi:hypothetical protein